MTKMREDFQRAAAKPDASKRVDGAQSQGLSVKPPPDPRLQAAQAAAKARGTTIHTKAVGPGLSPNKGPEPG